jgi:hypothetical protein
MLADRRKVVIVRGTADKKVRTQKGRGVSPQEVRSFKARVRVFHDILMEKL